MSEAWEKKPMADLAFELAERNHFRIERGKLGQPNVALYAEPGNEYGLGTVIPIEQFYYWQDVFIWLRGFEEAVFLMKMREARPPGDGD